MAYGLTSTGFNRKRLETIRQDILAKWKLRVSPTIDTSETGLEAQLAGAFAEEVDLVWQAVEAAFASRDPAQAQGQALDDLLSLRGLYRYAPRESLVTATVNVNAGTYPAGSLVAFVAGSPTSRFANDTELVAASPGTYSVLFRAEQTGPVRANAGTLTQVVPSTGFNSITNAADAALGDDGETDEAFYLRSESEFSSAGFSATSAAIARAIRDVDDVLYARVYENETDVTDGNGVPPHSIEAVVQGGTDAAVAQAILASKAGGIRAYGLTTVSTQDSQGNAYSVGLSRPTQVKPWLQVQVVANPATYPTNEVIRTLITDWGDSTLSVGNDVVLAQIVKLVMAQPGVYDVAVAQGGSSDLGPGSYVATNFVVGAREIADLDSVRVTVTNTPAYGPA